MLIPLSFWYTQLNSFSAEKFEINFIAKAVGKTERQLKYFMKKHNLRARNFANISDEELDILTSKIVQCFPTIGRSNFISF